MLGRSALLPRVLAGVLAAAALSAVPAATPAQAATATAPATVVNASVVTGGACNAYAGAHQLPGGNGIVPAAYSDSHVIIPACGPNAKTSRSPVHPYPGSLTTAGYQCVEFSRRYLFYRYGATANVSTNGDQIVDRYAKAYPQMFVKVNSGTVGKAPVPGDVMSFSPVPSFSDPNGGHTAVVQYSNVDSAGNGSLTLIEENASAGGVVILTMSNWRTRYGSFLYTKWLHPVVAGSIPAPSPTANGNFVSYGGRAYRIAGGAPIYITSWAVYGGAQPTTALTDAQFAALRVQPVNGTLLKGMQSGQVYRVVGGAPLFVASWGGIGGAQATTGVDDASLTNAGGHGAWAHLNAQPADGTLVKGGVTGQVYRFAGGAPLYVPKPVAAATVVDQAALTNAGIGTAWNHVRFRPVDGTFLRASSTAVYRVAGGAPLRITSCSPLNGCAGAATVDPTAVSNAGDAAPWNHLLSTVPTGSFVRVVDGPTAGQYARAIGGALVPVASCAAAVLGGCAGAVAVNAGSVSAYAAAHPIIANGTYLRVADGADVGLVAVAAGGALLHLSTCSPVGLGGCPGQVVIDSASYDAYVATHHFPAPGATVKALDTNTYWTFGTDCRAARTPTAAATALLASSISAYPTCVSVSTTAVPRGVAGVAYGNALTATGATGAYTWRIVAGQLPAGWTLTTTGVLGGVTRRAGTWAFIARATDQTYGTVTGLRLFRVTVLPMSIRTNVLPTAVRRAAYRVQLVPFGGVGKHFFRVTAGHLPPGLHLSSVGFVYGHATKAGRYGVAITMTDSSVPAMATMKVFIVRVR